MAKILVVEDDNFLLKVYKVKLEKLGFESIVLDNGSKALEVAKKEKPNLVLLDIIMPKRDGFDVLNDLKSDDETKDIPVVMLTALSTDHDREKAMNLGADKYLIKTDNSFQDVIEIVKKMVVK